MADIVIDFELNGMAQDARLAAAIDQFARAREQAAANDGFESDVPEIMVKTRNTPTGQLKKSLFFRDQTGKDTFMAIFNGVATA